MRREVFGDKLAGEAGSAIDNGFILFPWDVR
jgi:hypothetical protein